MNCEECQAEALIKVWDEGVLHFFCHICYEHYYYNELKIGVADWELVNKNPLPRRYAK